jgi:hypothetical protein
MKLTTISVVYERKLDLGNWNSARVGVTLWAGLDEDDDPAASAEALRQMARNNVMQEMARVKPELSAKVQDLFMGLPVDVQAQITTGDR